MGTNIFTDQMPHSPSAVVALSQMGGNPMDLVTRIEYDELEVKIRAATASACISKAYDIVGVLHGLHEQVIDSTRYLYISSLANPYFEGIDHNNRFIFTALFQVVKEWVTEDALGSFLCGEFICGEQVCGGP